MKSVPARAGSFQLHVFFTNLPKVRPAMVRRVVKDLNCLIALPIDPATGKATMMNTDAQKAVLLQMAQAGGSIFLCQRVVPKALGLYKMYPARFPRVTGLSESKLAFPKGGRSPYQEIWQDGWVRSFEAPGGERKAPGAAGRSAWSKAEQLEDEAVELKKQGLPWKPKHEEALKVLEADYSQQYPCQCPLAAAESRGQRAVTIVQS